MDILEAAKLDTVQLSERGHVPEDVKKAVFQKLRMKNENRTCFECSQRGPQWLSHTFGVYLCLDCAGRHRLMGVHISFVRGVELDQYSPPALAQMCLGGNAKAWAYFKQHGMGKSSDSGRQIEYQSRIALKYKADLEKEVADACKKFNLKGGSTEAAAAADPVDIAGDAARPAQSDAAAAHEAAVVATTEAAAAKVDLDFLDALLAAKLDEVPPSEKGFVAEEARNAFFRKMRTGSENRSCFECQQRGPQWLSITYGVFLCLDCAGRHRLKGVHLSFVRGCELDQFTPEQIVQMGVGGNRKAWAFFKTKGLGKTSDSGRAIDYNHKHAQAYKAQLAEETVIICKKLGCGKFAGAARPEICVDAAAGSANPPKTKSPLIKPAAAPAGPSVPKSVIVRKAEAPSGPTTTIIRKAQPATNGGYSAAAAAPNGGGYSSVDNDADWAPTFSAEPETNESPPAEAEKPVTTPVAVEKPVAKAAAKPMEFDFDFDDF